MPRFRRWLAPVVVGLVVALIGVLVVLAPGYPVRKLDLNDAGVWVTNDAEALYGRLNKSVEGLDGLLGTDGGAAGAASFSLDILQDGSRVIARDLHTGRTTPVNTALVNHETNRGISLDADTLLDLRGGTVAALDPATGRLWAGRYGDAGLTLDLALVDPRQKPIAELGEPAEVALPGQAAALSIGADGVVHAVSTNGMAVTIRPDRATFAEPDYTEGPARAGVQVAAVGGGSAVLDAQSGTLILPGGQEISLPPDPLARLQASSAQEGSVVVATPAELVSVGSDGPVRLAEGNGNAPAVPMVLGGCAFGAWPGEPGLVVRSCDGQPAQIQTGLDDVALVRPVFRTNHGLILLNDTSDGKVYSFEEQRFVDNWEESQPLPATDDGDPDKAARPDEEEPPRAHDDTVGARGGRTTVAHVLDNDTDPLGRVLVITSVTQPGGDASAQIAPDGQTILVTLPDDARSATFEYTISNGSADDSATVRIDVRDDGQNDPPRLRPGASERIYAVSSWGTLTIPVTGDWRDPDGDPISVAAVTAAEQNVGLTTDGRIMFTANRATETTVVPVEVSLVDGRADPVTATVKVKVLAYNATQGDAPRPEPDSVRGQVGTPVVIDPLRNDIPGADPLNPRAALELAAPVEGDQRLAISTDLRAGTVTVTAEKAGTYFVDYTAKYGTTAFAQGTMRIDVDPARASRPTATPDHVTIRGDASAMVDVLANDSDPSGSVLTVLSAKASDVDGAPSQLQVAVLKGRWLRVMPRATTLTPNPQVITYTVTNGRSAPVSGSVIVTQLLAPSQDAAVVNDDMATVRAGDSVLVDVLSNDSSASGEALVLDRSVDRMPAGQLPVIDPDSAPGDRGADPGRAYVVNDQVRYVAPATAESPRQVRIEYQAAAPSGPPSTGVVTVTVRPLPSEQERNTAPRPQNLEARASAGQTIEIPIQPWGQDADGDTVTVLGLASAPRQGRVLQISPNAITYQAYPGEGNGGTDSFRYLVTDRFGATESGLVRVAITEPGAVQPPVAVADTVIAEPDIDVQLHALANDMFDEVDPPRIVPFEDLGNEVPAGVSLAGEAGPILARTGGADEVPQQFAYALKNSGGTGPAAEVVVRAQKGYRNPPRTYDEVAEAEGAFATVDALRRAWDPDGPTSALRVTSVSNPEATVDGGTITVPLQARAQVVTYVVTDGTGAASASVIFVPPGGSGVPFLTEDASLTVDRNGSLDFDINDLVESPRGTPVAVTVAESLEASPGQLSVAAGSDHDLTLRAADDYSGPGAVTFEVRDGDPEDPETGTAVITVPVQVGEDVPVLRCPPFSEQLVQGGPPVRLKVPAVCTVWTSDPDRASTLTFSAEWATPLTDVSATAEGQEVLVQAGSNAVPGQRGVISFAVDGYPETAKEMDVEVVAAPRPTLVVSDISDVPQGTSVTRTIQLSSPLAEPRPTVVSIRQTSGMPAQARAEGNRFTITPEGDSHGRMTFSVVASDVADGTRTDRQVSADLSVTVYGVPGQMSPPQPSMQLRSRAASVVYTPPTDNGAPILEYQVSGGGQTVSCGRATRCDITGLRNGDPVRFTVRARNRAGWSEPSDPGPAVTPDRVPSRVPRFSAGSPSAGTLRLSWSPPVFDGSEVTDYVISFGGRTRTVPGSATSTTVSGLDNNAVYTFTILARNRAGISEEPASTTGQSSGRPVMSGLTVTGSDLGSTARVYVSWPAADPQGPRPVTYNVTRTGGSGTQRWTGLRGTTLGDTVSYDGTAYRYAVTATNATGGSAHTSAAVSRTFRATGTPGGWGSWSARATGSNGTITLSYTVPPSRGASSVVRLHGAGGTRTLSPGRLTTSTSFSDVDISGLTNGQNYALQLEVCNESRCTRSGTVSVTPYGRLSDPSLNVSVSGDQVTWRATGSGNGRNATLAVNDGRGTSTRSGSGSISLGPTTRTVGYQETVTVTATVSDPAGGRSSRTVTRQVTTGAAPPPPRSVSLWHGSRFAGDPAWGDFPCWYGDGDFCYRIGITTTGFEGQTYTCRLSSPSYTWSPVTYTGNVRIETWRYAGQTTLTLNCDGVRTTVNW
ncbi:MAG: Ig-like domain-containing protein [Propioniciclava sp.]